MKIRLLFVLLTFLFGANAKAQLLPLYSDMELSHAVSPGPYSIGDTITYTISIRNLGPDDNTGVVMSFKAFGARVFESPTMVSHYPNGNVSPQIITNTTLNSVTWYFKGVFPKDEGAVYTLRAIIDLPQFIPYFINVFTLGLNIDLNLLNNSIEKQLCAAPPKPGDIRGKKSLCINSSGNVLEVSPDENISRFKWVLPAGWTITSGFETNRIEFSTNGIQADWEVSVQSVNFCGESRGISTYNLTTVAIPPPMPEAIVGLSEVCAGSKNLSYSIDAVPGAVSYTWTLPTDWIIVAGEGTNAISVNAGSASGTVQVVAVNGCGGSAHRDLDVVVSPNVPAAPSKITGQAVVCANTGTAIYNIEAVANATRYEWTTLPGWDILSGQGTLSIVLKPGLGAGAITVSAVNACGSGQATTFNVLALDVNPIIGAISGVQVFCASNTSQTYSVTAVAGINTYNWSLPTGWSILSGQGTNQIVVKTGTASGNIIVLGTGVCGAETMASLPVTVSTQAPVSPSAITGSAVPCVGQEFTYSVNAVPGATDYVWSVPSGWTIIRGQGETSLVVKIGDTVGQVSVAAKNACSQSTAAVLAVTPTGLVPAVPKINGENLPCIGSQLTYNVAVPLPGLVYAWQVPAGWNIVSGQGTASVTVQVGGTSGQINVTASNGCGASTAASLSVTPSNGVPLPNFTISGPQTFCAGNDNILTYTVSEVTSAHTFQWQVPAGWSILSGQGTSEVSVKASSVSGNVTVSAQNGCGWSATKDLAVVVASQVVAAPAKITGLTTVCSNTETTYSIPAVAGALSYQWTVPTDWVVKSGQGTTALVVVIGSAGTVSVNASNSCATSPATNLNVAVSNMTLVAGNINGETAVCAGSNEHVYTTSAVMGATAYTWTVPTGWTIVSGQNSRTIRVKVAGAGTISVAVENACGLGVASTLAVTLSNQIPSVPLAITYSANGTMPCAGQSNVTYSVNSVLGADGYVWSVPSGWVILSGQGTASITVKPGSGAGEVQVAAFNGCGQTATQRLAVSAVNSAPPAPAAITGAQNVCANAPGLAFTVTSVAGATEYVWEVPASWTITSGQGTTAIQVTAGQTAGQIRVVAKNACGSSSASFLTVDLSQNPPAQVGPISGDKNFCVSDQQRVYTVAEAIGTKEYVWSVPAGWNIVSGQNSRTITVKPSSTSGYVKVGANNYCGSTQDSVLVTVNSTIPIALGAIQGDVSPCQGQEGVSYFVNPVAGVTSYTWTLPPGWVLTSGAGTNSIRVIAGKASGTVSVTAANACSTSNPATLAVAPVTNGPAVPTAIVGKAQVCAGDEQTYIVQNPVAGIVYNWSLPSGWTVVSGAGTSTLVVKVGSGVGSLSVVAQNSCGTSSARTLAVSPSSAVPSLGALTGSIDLCAGALQTYSVEVLPAHSTLAWVLPSDWVILSGAGTSSIQVRVGASSGNVEVTATNSCGQSSKKTLAVKVAAPLPTAPGAISGEKDVCAQRAEVVYSIAAVAGATSYEWKVPSGWTIVKGAGTTSITVRVGTEAGSIRVTAKNTCAVTTASSISVTISNALPSSLGPINGLESACAGQRFTYSVGPVAGVSTYQWTMPTGWVLASGQGTTSIEVIAGTAPGQISVRAQNGCGINGKPSIKQVQILNGSLLKPSVIQTNPGNTSPCADQEGLVFKVNPIAGATSYKWTYPADWKVQSGQGTNTITFTAGKISGAITVVAKNQCSTSESQTIAVVPKENVPVIAGQIEGEAAVCSSTSAVMYQVNSVSSADAVNWTVPSGWTVVSGQNTTKLVVIPKGSGTLVFTASNTCGGQAKKELKVVVNTNAVLVPTPLVGPKEFCLGTGPQVYEVALVAGATYAWQIPAGWDIVAGQGTNRITLLPKKAGAVEVNVTVRNACGKSFTAGLQVTVASELQPSYEIINESAACVGYQFSAPSQPGVTYTWSIVSSGPGWVIGEGQGTNRVKVQGPPDGRFTPAQIKYEVKNAGCSTFSQLLDLEPTSLAPEVTVPNAFSPNQDGKNDVWKIENLLSYPVNEVVVLNRWGSEVYRQKGYKNDWNGGGLADGTYFYYIKVRLCAGNEVTLKGYVMLTR